MSDSNPDNSSVTELDPISALKQETLKTAKEKLDALQNPEASKADKNKSQKQAQDNLNQVISDIDKLSGQINELEAAQNGVDGMLRQAKLVAALLPSETTGATVAKNVVESSKSIKAALDAIENIYPDAMSMDAKATSVDVKDTKEAIARIKAFAEKAKLATDNVEQWKNNTSTRAIDNSIFLKADIDQYIDKVKQLPTLMDKISKDIDEASKSKKTALEAYMDNHKKLQSKLDEIETKKTQDSLAIDIANEFTGSADPAKEKSTSQDNSSKGKNKK